MKNILFALSLFLLTGCYSQIVYKYPVKKPTYQIPQPREITHLLAVTGKGDTTQVDVDRFLLMYDKKPYYYSQWRFYWDNRWITPYSYYRFYHIPYQQIWVNYPYPSWEIHTGNKRPAVQVPSKPRSTGTTKQTRTRTKTETTRPTNRTGTRSVERKDN